MSNVYEYDKIAELVECFEDLPQMMNRIQANQTVGTRFRSVVEPNYSHNVTLALRNSTKFDPKAPENASQIERMAVQAKKVLNQLSNVPAKPVKIGKDIGTCAKVAVDKLSSLEKSGVDIAKFYKQYDTQRTGRLSYKDFSDTLLILSADIGREDAMLLAHSLDKKKTGTVDYNNLLPLLKDLQAKTTPSSVSSSYYQDDTTSISSRRNPPTTTVTTIPSSQSFYTNANATVFPPPPPAHSPQHTPRNQINNTNNNNNEPPKRRTRSAIRSEINTLTSVLDQLKSFNNNNSNNNNNLMALENIELLDYPTWGSYTSNDNSNDNQNDYANNVSQSYDTGLKATKQVMFQESNNNNNSNSYAPQQQQQQQQQAQPVVSQSVDSATWKQTKQQQQQQTQQQAVAQPIHQQEPAVPDANVIMGDDIAHLPLTALYPQTFLLPSNNTNNNNNNNNSYGTGGRRYYYRNQYNEYSASSGENINNNTFSIERLNQPTAPYYVDPPPKSKKHINNSHQDKEEYEQEMDQILMRNRHNRLSSSSKKNQKKKRSSSAPPRIAYLHQNSLQAKELLAHQDIFPPSRDIQLHETQSFLTQLSMENPCAQERKQYAIREQRTQEIEKDILENQVITQLAGQMNNFRYILKKQDASLSGKINYNEFKQGLKKAGIQLEENQMNTLFQQYAHPMDWNTIVGGYSGGNSNKSNNDDKKYCSSGNHVSQMIATSHAKVTPNDHPHLPPNTDTNTIQQQSSRYQGIDIESFIHDLEEKTLERDLFPSSTAASISTSSVTPATRVIPIKRPIKEFTQEVSSTRIAKQLLTTWQKVGSNPNHILSLVNDKHHGYLSQQELSDAFILMGNNNIKPYDLTSLLQHLPTNQHDGKYCLQDFYSLLRDKVVAYESKQTQIKQEYIHNATTRYTPSYASQIVLGNEQEMYSKGQQEDNYHIQKHLFHNAANQNDQQKQWERLKTILQTNYQKIFHVFHDDNNANANANATKLAIPTYTNGSIKTGEKLANNVKSHCIASSTELKSLPIDTLAKELSLAGIHLADQDISCLTQHIYAHKYNNNSNNNSSSNDATSPSSSSSRNNNNRKTLSTIMNYEEKKLSMDELCAIVDIPIKKHFGLLGGDCIEVIPREERDIRDEGIFHTARQAVGKERSTMLIPSMVIQSEEDVYQQLYGACRRKYPQSYESNYQRHSGQILDFNTTDNPMCFPHPIPSLRDPFPSGVLAAKRSHLHHLNHSFGGYYHTGAAGADDHSLGQDSSNVNHNQLMSAAAGGKLTAEALLAARLGTGGSLIHGGGGTNNNLYVAGKRTDANRPRNTLEFPPFATDADNHHDVRASQQQQQQQSYQDDNRSVGTRESRRSLGSGVISHHSSVSQLSRYSAGSQGSQSQHHQHHRRRAISAPPRNASSNSNQGEAMRQILQQQQQQPAIIRGGGNNSAKLMPPPTTPTPMSSLALEQGLAKWSNPALKEFYDKKQQQQTQQNQQDGNAGVTAVGGMTMGELNLSRDSTASASSYATMSTGTHTTRRNNNNSINANNTTNVNNNINGRQALRQQYETKNGSSGGMMTPFATDY